MGFLRPVPMVRIGLLGIKDDRPAILAVLHDLRIAQVEPVAPEVLREIAPERGSELQRTVSEQALRFRGLKAALPEVRGTTPERFEGLQDVLARARTVTIDEEVGALRREEDQLTSARRTDEERIELLGKIRFYPGALEDLHGGRHLTLLAERAPKADPAAFAAFVASAQGRILDDPSLPGRRMLVSLPKERVEAAVRSAASAGVTLTSLPELSGSIPEARDRLQAEIARTGERLRAIGLRLAEISKGAYGVVASVDEALQVEARLLDVLPKMAAGRASFALEAWVPERDVDRLTRLLESVAGGRVVLYRRPTDEPAPTLMDNPAGVRWFEFFIRFYSLPKATEWDPTLVFAIVFPIFFGFMIADWGYGLTILLVSLWMIAGFPGGGRLPPSLRSFMRTILGPSALQQLARTLVPGAIVALGFGLYYDLFFGVGVLHALVGYVPPAPPDASVPHLLLLAGFVGLGMVTLGFAMGALKEYLHHHYRGALGKTGGIVFAWGITFHGLGVLRHTSALLAPTPYLIVALVGGVAFVVGEGLQGGLLGLIEVVSHILSYTRLVGILLASVILAVLINTAAHGLAQAGGIGLLYGALILVIGQGFNVVLAVFEPAIQGMRLMFVEYFSKFYEGDGTEFRPFGGARHHTLPFLAAEGAAAPAPTTAR